MKHFIDFFSTIINIAQNSIKPALKTIWFLLKIMIPVSIIVTILDWMGLFAFFTPYLDPFMNLFGLPGKSALVCISSIFLNIYSAIAIIEQLKLGLREITILSIFCLTAHNMILETTIMIKTGSSPIKMIILRLFWAIVSAFILNILLPVSATVEIPQTIQAVQPSLIQLIKDFSINLLFLTIKVIFFVYSILFIQNILKHFGVLDVLSTFFSPVMLIFGLPRETSFLWIIINVVGYSYGAGILFEEIDSMRLTYKDGNLFNHHAAMCHSLFEDTALFFVLGVSLFWLIIPRIIMALIVTWAERFRRYLVMYSFRTGTL